MSEDHYFTAAPASADTRRTVKVRLAGTEFDLETAPGVFSPAHVDQGTQVLLDHVPPPEGRVLDLGCGWGPIALTAALLAPECSVTAVDVNERALDLLRRNVALVGARTAMASVRAVTAEQVAADEAFDTIWSNPPIRIGKEALHALLLEWLPRLADGGAAYLVVSKNLGADSLLTWLQGQHRPDGQPLGAVSRIATAKGFRVIEIAR